MTLPKLFGPEMLADPYPIYHKLRESNPVLHVARQQRVVGFPD